MANRSQNSSQLLEPSWDNMSDAGRGAEPVWREPTSVQSAPVQRPQYESHYEDQYLRPGEQREETAAANKTSRKQERQAKKQEAHASRSDAWGPVKLFLGVIGLAVAAGLLWGMADVARKHVARNKAPDAVAPANAQSSVDATAGGRAVSGAVR